MEIPEPCDTPSWICSSMGCQERPCSFRECNSSPKRKVPLPGSLSITRVPQEIWTQATPKTARGHHDHPFSRKQPLCEAVGHLHPGMFFDLFWDRGSLCPSQAWPWLVILSLLSAGLTSFYHHTWLTHVLQSQVPPSPTSGLHWDSSCPLSGKAGRERWSRASWTLVSSSTPSTEQAPTFLFTLLGGLRTQSAFLPRGVFLKPVSLSE